MNLIQYLQQGGFILPQYTQSNLSYEVPQAGNQAIDKMNQYAQQDMQNYIGLESLNISRKQADTSYFNSMIQNKLAIEREDRINKQTDLNNRKLELQEFTLVNEMINETMQYDQDNFLPRDAAALQKLKKEAGVDAESLYKNSKNLDALGKGLAANKQIGYAYKTGWDNKMMASEADAMLAESEKYEKYLNDLEAKGVPIDYKTKVSFLEARRNAINETVGFKQGKVAKMDLQGPSWQTIASMPDFINEVEQQIQTDLDRKTQAIKDQAEFAEAQNKLATANLNIAKTESEIAGRPYEEMKKNMDALSGIAKYAPTLSILAKAFPGADLTKPMNVLEAMNKATPAQLEELNKALAKMDDETKDHHHTSLNGALADCIVRGCSPEKIAQLKEGIRLSQTSNSNMNYSGIPARNDGGVGRGTNDAPVTNKDGTIVDYGTYQVNNNTGKVTHITVGNKSYDLSEWTKAGEVMAQVEEIAPKGSGKKAAVLRINYNSEQGMKFLQFNVGARKDGETNKQWAERYLRVTLSAQGAPKESIDRLVKNGLEVNGIVRVARDIKKSGQTTKSTTPNPTSKSTYTPPAGWEVSN